MPNVRSLRYSGQQIRSCESGKAATDDGNFGASRAWIRTLEITHLCKAERSAEGYILSPSLALNAGLERHGGTEAVIVDRPNGGN